MRNSRTDTTHACPVVGRREMQREQKAHRERLQNMKSALDTRAPAPQPHLTLYGRDYAAKKRATTEAAFADLKMIQAIARTMTREHKIEERKGPVSLNADGRKNEIYRIMAENHKLLDSIENCESMMRTTDMVKADKFRQRYIINASHTARLSGDYDDEIGRIKHEEKSKIDDFRRTAQIRFANSQRMKSTGSVSLPTLSPNGHRGAETPPTVKPASLPKASGRGRGGASSSSSGGYKGTGDMPQPPAPEPLVLPPAESQEPEKADDEVMKSAPPEDAAEPARSSRQPVRFDIQESEGSEGQSTQVNRTKTPHPGAVDLSNFPEDEGDDKQQDVAASVAEFQEAMTTEKTEQEVTSHTDAVAASQETKTEEKNEQEVAAAVESQKEEVAASQEEVAASFTEEVAANQEEESYEETFEAEEQTFEGEDEGQPANASMSES